MNYDSKLKEAMAEIFNICDKHDIAGHFILVSKTHSEFGFKIDPSWSAANFENGHLRIKAKASEIGKEKAGPLISLTCHIFYQIRDICALGFEQTSNIIKMIEQQVKVEHKPFSNFEPHKEQ